ncbi:transglycosylase domain-containing protein [Roseomonas sp. USHLN139]|uniref:transglycosylase domain-containing protein n=1 Tax=Roseomonas sp. USHLN139 TaxID=3081298 RepID=UPI003B02D781
MWIAACLGRSDLSAPDPTPWLADRHGAFLAQFGHQAGERVEYGYWALPPPERLVRATLALEDRRFRDHPGVDPLAVLRAAWGNLTGRPRSGASTIAMQVVRLQRPAPRGLWPKSIEAGAALLLTARHGRDAVLAQYLRLVPYGNGSHGIGHAARLYFDKPAGDLGWAEISLLSAIPQAPTLHNPWREAGLRRARARGLLALDRLAAEDAIPAEELSTARAQLAALRLPPAPRRPEDLGLVLRLQHMLAEEGAEGLDPAEPRLRASLDLGLQARLRRLVARHWPPLAEAGAEQVALMAVSRRDNRVRVAITSAGPGTPGGGFDYTAALRSPGSTLKPFLFGLALQRGQLTPTEIMADVPDGASGIGNADGQFLGPLLPRQALANSRNVPAVTLLRRVGLETTLDHFHTLGLTPERNTGAYYGLALAIGGLPTRLDRLMGAYAALADDGVMSGIIWYDGQPRPRPRRILAADAARQIGLFLSDPQARLPSFPRYGHTEFPFPVALKTGTSQGYRDGWMLAWSADWLVGGWVGRADAGPMQGLGGANGAGPLVQAAMLALHAATPDALLAGHLPAPQGSAPASLCAESGAPDEGQCRQVLVEWLAPGATPPVIRASAPAVAVPPGLAILSPENNSRIWRNPETPPALARLRLRASAPPGTPQLLWLVDGEPFATAAPGETVWWPLRPGRHRIELRLPFAEAGRSISISVE